MRTTQRRCKVKTCRQRFTPTKPFQLVCDDICAAARAAEIRVQLNAKREREQRKETRAKLEQLKTRSDYIKEAQGAFNAYIRARDRNKPCICCGRPLSAEQVGGGFDAGHYRSTGSAPHLRFDERNCHGQAKQCNRYGAGRAVDYRIGLIARIGLAAVEALESDNAPRKWSIDDLRAIKAEYAGRLKAENA